MTPFGNEFANFSINKLTTNDIRDALTFESLQKNPFGLLIVSILVGVWLGVGCMLRKRMQNSACVLSVPYWKRNEDRGFWYLYLAMLHEYHRHIRAIALLPLKHESRTQKWYVLRDTPSLRALQG